MSSPIPENDAHFTVETVDVVPDNVLAQYRERGAGYAMQIKKQEQDDIRKAVEVLKDLGERGWNDVTTEKGDKVRIAYVKDVSSVSCYTDPQTIEHQANGRVNAKTQIVAFSSQTQTATCVTVNIFDMKLAGEVIQNLDTRINIALSKWFVNVAQSGIKGADSVSKLRNCLINEGVMDGGQKFHFKVFGGTVDGADVVELILIACFGGVLGLLLRLVVYLFKRMTLTCYVYNFDTEHEWDISNMAGVNEERVGANTNFIVTRASPMGDVNMPGVGSVKTSQTMVHYTNVVFQNQHTIAGGFTVTGEARRIPHGDEPPMSFNWGYRVEKAASNSMALASSSISPMDYAKTKDQWQSKDKVSIDEPLRVVATTPEDQMFTTPDDKYVMQLKIGKEPLKYGLAKEGDK